MTVLAALLTAGTVLVGNASAQVSVVNQAVGQITAPTAGSFSINYTVANANDALVLGVYLDNGSPGISSMTYNGVAASGSILAPNSGGGARISLFYFLNPTVGAASFSGTEATANTSNGSWGFYVWELMGVDLTAPVAASGSAPSTSSGSATIVTTANDSFITDFLGINVGGNNNDVPAAGSILTFDGSSGGSMASGYIAAGSATAATAGTQQLGWTGASTANYGEAAFAFAPAPVPEPSTMALSALGGLAVLMIRQRSKR